MRVCWSLIGRLRCVFGLFPYCTMFGALARGEVRVDVQDEEDAQRTVRGREEF